MVDNKDGLAKPQQDRNRSLNPGQSSNIEWDSGLSTYYPGMSCERVVLDSNWSSRALAGECNHNLMNSTCPCPNRCKFLICMRCFAVFCSDDCLQFVDDQAYPDAKQNAIVSGCRNIRLDDSKKTNAVMAQNSHLELNRNFTRASDVHTDRNGFSDNGIHPRFKPNNRCSPNKRNGSRRSSFTEYIPTPKEEPVRILRDPLGLCSDQDTIPRSRHSGSSLEQINNKSLPSNPLETIDRDLVIDDDTFLCFGVAMMVNYSCGDSIYDFHVLNSFGISNNDRVDQAIQNLDGAFTLETVQKNTFCLARKPGSSNKWCRAKTITDLRFDHVKIYFIDYGRTETARLSDLLEMPPALMKCRPSAFRITIGDFEKFDEISNGQLDYCFKTFILNKSFRVTIFEDAKSNTKADGGQVKYLARIEIKHEEKYLNLTDVLVNDGFGRKVLLKGRTSRHNYRAEGFPNFTGPQTEIPVIMGNINNPNDFNVIPLQKLAKRNKMMEKLNSGLIELESYPTTEWFQSGYLCLVKRTDGKWARAKIQSISEGLSIEVRFIDFGEKAVVDIMELKALPRKFMNIAGLAHQCSLPVFPKFENWMDSDITFFKNVADCDEIYVVVFAIESEYSIHVVEVLVQNVVAGISQTMLQNNICLLKYNVDLGVRNESQNGQQTAIASGGSSSLDLSCSASRRDSGQDENRDNLPKTDRTNAINSGSLEYIVFKIGEEYPFKSDQIKPAEPLQNLHQKTEFKIQHGHKFNTIYITPCINFDQFMHLQDEVRDRADYAFTFDTCPSEGSVVIAPHEDSNFYRAVIRKVISSRKVQVTFIDLGCESQVDLKTIKPANESVMKYPQRGYEVQLKGLKETPELILWSELIHVMKEAKKLKYRIQSCIGDTEPYVVSLVAVDSIHGDASLSALILEKQVWKWESIYKQGCETDKEMFSKAGWTMPVNIKDQNVAMLQLPLNIEMEGKLSRKYVSKGSVHVVNIQEPSISRDDIVLQNQVKRYMETVTHTKFHPTFNEAVMVFIKDDPQLQKFRVRGINRWNRCYRDELYLTNLDIDELYPLKYVNSDILGHCFVLRRCCPEFFRVPLGTVHCIIEDLKDFEKTQAVPESVKDVLSPEKMIKFTVKRYDKKKLLYVIECPEITKKIACDLST